MEREVPAERRNAASLGDEQVVELARLARDIEDHYQTPQDVEFAVERSKSGQKVYVVQTRPETFWARMKSPSELEKVLCLIVLSWFKVLRLVRVYTRDARRLW